MSNWTKFMDMHSGGSTKENGYNYIYINKPEDAACEFFEKKFGHDPFEVTCDCCGADYSVTEYETLAEATAYERGCAYIGDEYIEQGDPERTYRPHVPLEEYLKCKDVLVVDTSD